MKNVLRSEAGRRGPTFARKIVRLAPLAPLVLSVACVAPPIETFPRRPAALAVVTWNMDVGRGDLRRLMTDLETGRLTRAPAEHLVVLLQEAVAEESARLAELAAARRWSVFLVPVFHDGRHTRSNAIVSSRPMTGRRAISLPYERQPRAAAAAAIDVAGQRLIVASVHLENRATLWKTFFSDAARRRQAHALVDALPTTGHGVVGGDLNTWLGRHEPAWHVLAERFADTPRFTRSPTFRDRLVLDHLFFDLPEGWTAQAEVIRDRYGSDHHPVVAVINASSRAAAR